MTAFVDGVTAYTVTRSEEYDGWIVVVVKGYHPMRNLPEIHSRNVPGQKVVDKPNHQMGFYKDEELAVAACSMFSGMKHEDALQRFRDKRRPARPKPGGAGPPRRS